MNQRREELGMGPCSVHEDGKVTGTPYLKSAQSLDRQLFVALMAGVVARIGSFVVLSFSLWPYLGSTLLNWVNKLPNSSTTTRTDLRLRKFSLNPEKGEDVTTGPHADLS